MPPDDDPAWTQPKRTEITNVRMSPDERAALDRVAEFHKCNSSEAIRTLIQREAERIDKKEKQR